MEARALSVEEGEKFFSFSTVFLSGPLEVSQSLEVSQGKLNQAILTQTNGAGRKANIKVWSDVGVNGGANGKVLSARDWEEMWEYVVSSRFVRDEIKRRHGYITGILVEDLVRDAYVVGMEVLKECRKSNCCEECLSVECEVWERRFRISFCKVLRRLQDLRKRGGRVNYLEVVEEEEGEERLPTAHRKDWDLSANWKLDPLMMLCSQEEEEEKKGKNEERLMKVREALKKLNKREREAWELLLSGVEPREVARRLGYRKVQGVYMVIRRGVKKIRKHLAKSMRDGKYAR